MAELATLLLDRLDTIEKKLAEFDRRIQKIEVSANGDASKRNQPLITRTDKSDSLRPEISILQFTKVAITSFENVTFYFDGTTKMGRLLKWDSFPAVIHEFVAMALARKQCPRKSRTPVSCVAYHPAGARYSANRKHLPDGPVLAIVFSEVGNTLMSNHDVDAEIEVPVTYDSTQSIASGTHSIELTKALDGFCRFLANH